MPTLPLANISVANTLAHVIGRVEEIVEILNTAVVPIKTANAVSADNATGGASADWKFRTWSGNVLTDPQATNTGGVLVLDGGVMSSANLYNASVATKTLEFTATYSTEGFQHLGFAIDLITAPYAIFTTHDESAGFCAKVWPPGAGSFTLVTVATLASIRNISHVYKIVWASTGFSFYIDNVLKTTIALPIAADMNIMASDFSLNSVRLRIDSLTIS